jgi:hypothetical protein
MGAPEYHPSPSHTPPMANSSWSSIARKNTQNLIDSDWRPASARCQCPLSVRPAFSSDIDESSAIDLDRVLFYAHKYDSFPKAHADFDAVKDQWTPELFGAMIGRIDSARCTKLDHAVREFHQQIRNNGLWQCWIDQVCDFPHFENLLLDELAHVLENLSPRYLKDVKIEHLLKIFEAKTSTIHGKKRKLKRQITKWIETQSEDVLNEKYEEVNTLKWLLQRVIEQKDKEQEERTRNKNAYQYNWRQKAAMYGGNLSSASSTSSGCNSSRTASPAQPTQHFAGNISSRDVWPELRKAFESGPNGISIGA